MTTGWVCHERYFWHDTGTAVAYFPSGGMLEPELHVESPASRRRFRNLLEASGLLDQLQQIRPRPALEEEVLRYHTPSYLERVKEVSATGGGYVGEQAPIGGGGYEIAMLAVGGCLKAVEEVAAGNVSNAYALVRPPGHHAEADTGFGFCIFSNVALAALHARRALGLERVAIVDLDCHHGNGSQKAFWSDPSVLMISLHQDNYFPTGSGAIDEIGEGEGRGFTLNVPLPAGSGVGAYVSALRRIVAPAVRGHRSDLILVSMGFDTNALDPLGRQMVHSDGYRAMTGILMDVAGEVCGGRLVFCHEGGYSTAYVPFCGLAVVETLSGISTGVEDPFLPILTEWAGQDLQPHQESAITAAASNLARVAGR